MPYGVLRFFVVLHNYFRPPFCYLVDFVIVFLGIFLYNSDNQSFD